MSVFHFGGFYLCCVFARLLAWLFVFVRDVLCVFGCLCLFGFVCLFDYVLCVFVRLFYCCLVLLTLFMFSIIIRLCVFCD